MDLKELFGYEGKNVVITGAGSGMGYAASRLLKELGANVYATVRRKPLDFPVAKEIKADLNSQSGVDAVIAELPESVDALFICHGISNNLGKTNAMEVQLTNFYSFKYLTEKLLQRITDNGSVTFISSDGGKDWRSSLKDCLEIIHTSSWKEAILEKFSLEFWNGRWASPEEMGYPLVTIGSKIFSYMSGQVLYINYGTSSLWEIGELQKGQG